MLPFAAIQPLAQKSDNPRANMGFTEVKINRKIAETYLGIASQPRPDLADWVRANCQPVRDELDTLAKAKQADPIGYARRIIVFAILSAQVNFAENLYCLNRVIDNLDSLTDAESIAPYLIAPYRGYGNLRKINYWQAKAKYLAEALPTLRGIRESDISHEFIRSIKGVGPKIAAFATALWDQHAQVFTLDTWMYRLTAAIVGQPVRINAAPTDVAYSLTEGDWLAWCRRALPDLPPFVVQWSLWNGCFGIHKSHLGILGG